MALLGGSHPRPAARYGRICVKAFKSPPEKPHKVSRFLGLAMMAARVHHAIESGVEAGPSVGTLDLATPLFPQFDLSNGSIIVFAFEPDRLIWASGNVDADLLRITCSGLDKAEFAVSVARATELLRQLGRLPRR
jgi:hypothetical protein